MEKRLKNLQVKINEGEGEMIDEIGKHFSVNSRPEVIRHLISRMHNKLFPPYLLRGESDRPKAPSKIPLTNEQKCELRGGVVARNDNGSMMAKFTYPSGATRWIPLDRPDLFPDMTKL